MSQLPRNAESLIAMRSKEPAEVPALPILISLVGSLGFNNLTLYANAGTVYDWHLIAGLEVEVFASAETLFSQLLSLLAAIAAAVPKHMVLTFVDGPRIDCGEMRTVTDFALFDWFPMTITPTNAAPAAHIEAWNSGRIIEQKLWKALGKELPIPYEKAMDLVVQIAKENQQ
jgi:hypothetical protein